MLPQATGPPRQQRGGGALRAGANNETGSGGDQGRGPARVRRCVCRFVVLAWCRYARVSLRVLIRHVGVLLVRTRVSLRRVGVVVCRCVCVAPSRWRAAGTWCAAARVPSPRARYAGARACVAACVAPLCWRVQVRACVAGCVAPSRWRCCWYVVRRCVCSFAACALCRCARVRRCVSCAVVLSCAGARVRRCLRCFVALACCRCVRVPAAAGAYPAAPSRPDQRLSGSLGYATGQLCGF